MNDTSFAIKAVKPIIYADDSTLTSILSTFDINCNDNNNNSYHINSKFDKISYCLKLNKLYLNPRKAKCMVFYTHLEDRLLASNYR